MAGYLGAVPVPQATQHRDTFTATDGQTTFNVQPYTPTFLDVYLNGVRLNAADVTATNGTSVVLVACETDDIVDVISYAAFEVGSLSANSVDSDQYVDGSIDTVHIADAQVTVAKMAANSVDSDQYVDGSIDTAHIANVNVTQGKIADQAINEAKMQVSNAPTNGYFLSAQSGNTGGMTWAEAGGDATGASAVIDMNPAGDTTFSGIPSGVRWVTFALLGVNSSANPVAINFELGTSSGLQTSGYVSIAIKNTGGTITSSKITSAFHIRYSNWGYYSDRLMYGAVNLTRVADTNQWMSSATINGTDSVSLFTQGGTVTLGGELTQLKTTSAWDGPASLVWGY